MTAPDPTAVFRDHLWEVIDAELYDVDEADFLRRIVDALEPVIRQIVAEQRDVEIEHGRVAVDYVGKLANRLGVPDPAAVRRRIGDLERVGEAALAKIERLRAVEEQASDAWETWVDGLSGDMEGAMDDLRAVLDGAPSAARPAPVSGDALPVQTADTADGGAR